MNKNIFIFAIEPFYNEFDYDIGNYESIRHFYTVFSVQNGELFDNSR